MAIARVVANTRYSSTHDWMKHSTGHVIDELIQRADEARQSLPQLSPRVLIGPLVRWQIRQIPHPGPACETSAYRNAAHPFSAQPCRAQQDGES